MQVRAMVVVGTVPLRRRLVRLLRSHALPMAPRERLDLLGPQRLVERARRESAHLLLVEDVLLPEPSDALCADLGRLPSAPWVLRVSCEPDRSVLDRPEGAPDPARLVVGGGDQELAEVLAELVTQRRRALVARLLQRFGPEPAGPDGEATILPAGASGLTLREARRVALENFERAYFTELLRRTGGRIGETARLADIDPRSLYDKLDYLGLHKEDFRPAAAEGRREGKSAFGNWSPEGGAAGAKGAQSSEQAPGPRGSPHEPQGPGGQGPPPASGP